jgi:hypothetical protein
MQLANEHEQAGRIDEAEKILRHILAEAPDHHPALHLLGVVAFRRGKLADMVLHMERSIALAPMEPLYRRNICEAYRMLGRFDEALAAGQRAAVLAPDDVHSHHNLGVVHYHRLELDEAIKAAEQAIAVDPEFAGAHLGIAEAALLRGDFARGWDEYEWRFKLDRVAPLMPETDRPQWDGTPLQDGLLLLIADQGYGDVIQFARYIPWAAGRCPRLAIACSRELQPVVCQQAGEVRPRCSITGKEPRRSRPIARCPACRASPGHGSNRFPPRRPCGRTRRARQTGRNGSMPCCRAAISALALSGPAGPPIATTTPGRPSLRHFCRWRRSREPHLCRCRRGQQRRRSAVIGAARL